MVRALLAALLAAAPACAEDYRDYLCRDVRRPFFKAEALAGGARRVSTNRALAARFEFVVPAPPKTKRVFVVGESVAGIFWGASPGRDALTAMADAAAPGLKTDHINCGMTAYNSKRIEAVFREALAYDPDLLVLMTGNNEGPRFEYCSGYLEDIDREFRRWFAAGGRGDEPLAEHEWHLRRMLRAAREKRKPVVVCTLPANLTGYAPWGAAPFGTRDFVKAWLAYERKDPAAVKAFESLARADPKDPFARFYLGRALEAAGRRGEARAAYEEAVALDSRADRCSKARNAMLRRVAAEEGAKVADLEALFAEAAPGGLVGDAMIVDGVHWRERWNPLVAWAVLEAAGPPWAGPRLAAERAAVMTPRALPEEEAEETRKMLLYAARHVSYWAGNDHDGRILELGVVLLDRVAAKDPELLARVSKNPEAMRPVLANNFWVRDLPESIDRWWPLYLQHLGEMHRRRGRCDLAVGYLTRAAKLCPSRYLIRLQRALALHGAGKRKEAAEDFRYLDGVADPSVGIFAEALGYRKG